MPRRNGFGILVAALGLIAAQSPDARAAGRRQDVEGALRLLVRAFDRKSPRNVVAVMRMSLNAPGAQQTVKVQISTDGRQRIDVIEPLQQSGVVIVDHDDIREVFSPDSHTLSIGRSMVSEMFRPEERLALVRRNYRLTTARRVPIAHRSAVRIDATSKYADVGSSSIYIDPETWFVMRVETVAGGHRSRRFDTTTVEYPVSLPAGTFDIHVSDAKTIRQSDPIPVQSIREAERHIGFRPSSPGRLPFGFVMRKIYYRADPGYTTIGFNMSDGVASATVFEFDLAKCGKACREQIGADMKARPNDYIRVGRIIVGIVSDLGPKARRKLLTAFGDRGHTSLNDAEKALTSPSLPVFSAGPGTNRAGSAVSPFRSMWQSHQSIG